MSSRPVALVATVLLGCLGAGCGPEDPPAPAAARPPGPVEIRVTRAMAGASTALKVGHVLRIELPAYPETGCAWEIEAVDESVLRVPVEEYLPPEVEGEAGTSIWRFEALSPGSTTVRLRCVKFGEDVPTEVETFTFDVLVD